MQPKIPDNFQEFLNYFFFYLVQMPAVTGRIQYLYFTLCYCSYQCFILCARFQPRCILAVVIWRYRRRKAAGASSYFFTRPEEGTAAPSRCELLPWHTAGAARGPRLHAAPEPPPASRDFPLQRAQRLLTGRNNLNWSASVSSQLQCYLD